MDNTETQKEKEGAAGGENENGDVLKKEEEQKDEVKKLEERPAKRPRTTESSGQDMEVDLKEKKENEKEENDEEEGEEGRPKKIKVGLLVEYAGFEYQGLQLNPGAKTIEKELHQALIKSGCIEEVNQVSLQKVAWQRCARTDKGVSALGQVLSCKIILPDGPPFEESRQKINSHLPSNIKIFHIQRVPRSFNAKNACDSRTYEYLCPVSAFDPVSWFPLVPKTSSATSSSSSSSSSSSPPSSSSPAPSPSPSPSDSLSTSDAPASPTPAPEQTEPLKERITRYLKKYEGAHSYHNFTPKVQSSDKASSRNIISFTCSDPFEMNGVGFVSLVIKGQSFMLHQIRNMIALLVWAVSTNQPDWVISASFLHDISFKIFMVPGDFLLLRACHFDYFFQKKKTAVCRPVTFDQFEEERDTFKKDFIIPVMVQKIQEGIFSEWNKAFREKFFEMECLLPESVKKRAEAQEIEEKRRRERSLSRKRKK